MALAQGAYQLRSMDNSLPAQMACLTLSSAHFSLACAMSCCLLNVVPRSASSFCTCVQPISSRVQLDVVE